MINRSAQTSAICHLPDANQALVNRERPVGWNDVDAIRLERLAIAGLLDPKRGRLGQKLRMRLSCVGSRCTTTTNVSPAL
jgi:hypothetical protein